MKFLNDFGLIISIVLGILGAVSSFIAIRQSKPRETLWAVSFTAILLVVCAILAGYINVSPKVSSSDHPRPTVPTPSAGPAGASPLTAAAPPPPVASPPPPSGNPGPKAGDPAVTSRKSQFFETLNDLSRDFNSLLGKQDRNRRDERATRSFALLSLYKESIETRGLNRKCLESLDFSRVRSDWKLLLADCEVFAKRPDATISQLGRVFRTYSAVKNKLERRTDYVWDARPVSGVLKSLSENTGIVFRLDEAALVSAGADLTPVTSRLFAASVDDFLGKLLQGRRIGFYVEEDGSLAIVPLDGDWQLVLGMRRGEVNEIIK